MDSVIPAESCDALIEMMLTPYRLFGFKCGKMIRNDSEDDGYTLHFHSAGKLRWWKKSISMESHKSGVVVMLTKEQCAYIMANHPTTFGIAWYWLEEVYGIN